MNTSMPAEWTSKWLEAAVVAVSYNGQRWIRDYVPFMSMQFPGVRATVVYNASTDDAACSAIEESSQVQFIRSKQNLGFGCVNNSRSGHFPATESFFLELSCY